MKPSRIGALVAVLLVAALLVTGTRGSALSQAPGYVALGDSIEAGFGASLPALAWVPLFRGYLEGLLGPTDLINLGIPGATTRDILQQEVASALAAIATHSPVVVSWGGGGNDLLDFITSPQAATCMRGNASCLTRLNALLNEAQQTIDLTVRALWEAAGPGATILLRTQYNPLLKTGCDPSGALATLAAVVLEGGPPPFLTRGLNDRIRDIAAKYDTRVIEIYQVFAANADTYLAADCVHPSDAGHNAIFAAAVVAF